MSFQTYPGTLRIRGKRWTVRLVRGMRGFGLRGTTMIDEAPRGAREIHISSTLGADWRVRVFHHELLHACFPSDFYKGRRGPEQRLRANVQEEEIVMPLGAALNDALTSPEYPALLAWLRETTVKHRDGWDAKGGA